MKKNGTPSLDLRGDETSLLLLLFVHLRSIPIGLTEVCVSASGKRSVVDATVDVLDRELSVQFQGFVGTHIGCSVLKRFGRRKSWLVPVQILTGVAMIVGSSWLPVALNSDDVAGLTACFSLCTS